MPAPEPVYSANSVAICTMKAQSSAPAGRAREFPGLRFRLRSRSRSLATAMLAPLAFILLPVTLAGVPSLASAQAIGSSESQSVGRQQREETDGPSMKLGETDLYPTLRVDAVQNRNAFRTPDDETSATGFVVSPRLLWIADRRLLTLRATYDGEYSQNEESALEHADHQLGLGLTAAISSRSRFDGLLRFTRGHQVPGINFTRSIGDSLSTPVKFNQSGLNGSFTYGAAAARGNLTFGLNVSNRDYTNLDFVTEGRDYLAVEPYARFSLRVSGDTRALFELRYQENDFSRDTLDRQDASVLVGATFAATGQSTGELKVGATTSTYDSDLRDDVTTTIVEGNFFYQPREFSFFEFRLMRELDNATGVSLDSTSSDATVRDTASLDWNHDWSERVAQRTYLGYESLTRGCPELGETTATAGLELSFSVRRWLDLGGSAQIDRGNGQDCNDADASIDASELDYDTVRAGIFLKARL